MTDSIRMTHATALVLRGLDAGHAYGFDLMDATGLPSGTVYPILRRLEEAGLVRGAWEESESAEDRGRPRRRYYELTAEGRDVVPEATRRLAGSLRLLPDALLDAAGGEG